MGHGVRAVSARGFAKLHGRDGVLRPFTLTSVELAQCAYPRAHRLQPHRPAFIRLPARLGGRAAAVALDPRHAKARWTRWI